MTTIIVLGIIFSIAWGVYKFATMPLGSESEWSVENELARFGERKIAPERQQQITEVATVLQKGRERSAANYGKQTLTEDGIQHGNQQQFRSDWKEFCNVVEAKYGNALTYDALYELNLNSYS